MNATEALRDAENSLRDFMAERLAAAYGNDWVEKLGVKPEKLTKWRERLEEERKKMRGAGIEERLLYYADFYDIAPLIRNHWVHFSDALLDLKTIEMWLGELEKYRDADAHRRPLFDYQKHLIVGISGDIRSRIVRYRSKMEKTEDYFPRIDSVRESLGRVWKPMSFVGMTPTIVRVGDIVEFVVAATDPTGADLQYCCRIRWSPLAPWSTSNCLKYEFTAKDIGRRKELYVMIKGIQEHHAHDENDDMVVFAYDVLPARNGNSKSEIRTPLGS